MSELLRLILIKRPRPSGAMRIVAPLSAVAAMVITGLIAFALLGRSPVAALYAYFIEPIATVYGVGELLLKATPLMLCATGLALGFRSNVWNIGAEGQLTVGAIAGGGVALYFSHALGGLALPAMLLAGMVGGMTWAAIPALLKTRFHTSEILVSLMLVYIAQLLLSWLVREPWRDPAGYGFPQSAELDPRVLLPALWPGTRATIAAPIALAVAGLSWFFSARTFLAYQMEVTGLAPEAAAYAGFGEKRAVWLAMLIGGALAGLAGLCEVAGPIGRLQPTISPGYGFAAIIVAFIGRLHPVGIVLASLLLSLLYLGGESVQVELGLPAAISGLFQGMLLFYLLAADLFVDYRLARVRPEQARAPRAESLEARS
jgi:simple sugar transport system permease protein